MSTSSLVADVLWNLGQKAVRYTRKRAPGDEDHWFPKVPEAWGLFKDQCRWCLRILPGRPARGCDANIIPPTELAAVRAQQQSARDRGLDIVAVDAHGRVRGFGRLSR